MFQSVVLVRPDHLGPIIIAITRAVTAKKIEERKKGIFLGLRTPEGRAGERSAQFEGRDRNSTEVAVDGFKRSFAAITSSWPTVNQ